MARPAMPIQPQDLVLTMLGAHLRRPGDLAWSGGMVELLQEFGFSREAARAALSRLATRRLIDRVRRGRQVHYRLTDRAERLLEEGDRRIFTFGRDDTDCTRWTVLWHSLPERRRVERARLGRRLRFLGFGSVQDATWVAPHDREAEVLALLAALGIKEYAYVLVGRPSGALPIDTVLREAWDLPSVVERYEAFLEELAPYRRKRARTALDDRAAFVLRIRTLHRFRGFPFLDPELPDGMMPRPGLRPQVVRMFHLIYEELREPAERHFRAVAGL
jgi:phenylacetic acid degradation operon negative regulatory protein